MGICKLAVVHESYCVAQQVQLMVREKMLCYSSDDYTIVDLSSKQPWFKLKGKAFSGSDRTKKFLDAQGNVLARVKEHPVAVPKRMVVKGSGFSFEVVKKVTLNGTEATAVVRDCTTQQKHTVHIYGNLRDRTMEVYLGRRNEGGSLLACAERRFSRRAILSGRHKYVLNVEPGADIAMCVLMCITYDEFPYNSEQ